MTSSTRYRSDFLLPGGESMDILSDGVVDVVDDVITWSGAASDAPVHDGDVVSVSGLLLPTLVNGHCHTPMVLFRGAGEGLPVDRWLSEVMWPRESKLTPADVRAGMALGLAEMLTNGIGTSSEMYFHAEAMADAVEAANFRSTIAAPFIEAESFAGLGPITEQIESAIEFARGYVDHRTIRTALGPHSVYSLSPDTLQQVGQLGIENDMLVHIHVSELPGENQMVAGLGPTVVQILDGLGLLTPKTVAAHGIWVNDDDIAILAERGVGVCHCPVSNMGHGMGVAPLMKLREHGVDVCLGTDGPASHYRLDMFEEMRSVLRMHRLDSGDAGIMQPSEALRMATSTGAKVLGLDDVGQLRAGFRADMLNLDLDQLSFGPILSLEEIPAAVVWGGSRAAVRNVWIDGNPSVIDGVPIGTPVAELQAEVLSRATSLAKP